ncbi:uncharacterized protein LOC115686268 [Syzygium oleosum]|uniref:uncharacterized protein LOC115686268 n=1 Tax=Syzygium oleosum TaxID=219896 RepID=UPI0024BA6609|nr:uncharacterized protein LOC115686268 [Syzygium oleosum]
MVLQLRDPPPPPPTITVFPNSITMPPPQTVTVFPNTLPMPPPPPSQQHSHSSNGSFGTVFMVLAIVLAVSAIACCLGRFCNRRSRSGDPPSKQDRRPRPKENDIEFGFDGKTLTVGNPMAGNDGGPQMIHDKDKAGLGGGFRFQTRPRVDEPKPGAA